MKAFGFNEDQTFNLEQNLPEESGANKITLKVRDKLGLCARQFNNLFLIWQKNMAGSKNYSIACEIICAHQIL